VLNMEPTTTMTNSKAPKKRADSTPSKPQIPSTIDLSTLHSHHLNRRLEGLPEDEWQAVEANAFCCGLCDDSDFVPSQVDLIAAQWPERHRLLAARTSSTKKPQRFLLVIKFLHDLVEKAEAYGNRDLADYARYQLACWTLYHVIRSALNGNSQHVNECFTSPQYLYSQKDKRAEWFREVVDGAVRYCSSTFKNKQSPSTVVPAAAAVTGNTSSITIPCKEAGGASRDGVAPEQVLGKDAMSFHYDLSQRRNLPTWKDMRAVQPELHGYLLEEMCNQTASLTDQSWKTPEGILSHGAQGTGKSVFVEAFCQAFEIQLYVLDASVKQSLVGQSEE